MNKLKTFSYKPLYWQILFVIFAFVLMIVINYFFSRNFERRHLEIQVEDSFTNIESLLKADLKELEIKLGTVSETIRGMFLSGFDLEIIKKYMTDMTAYGLNNEENDGFFGFFAGFGEDGMNGFNALHPDADWDEIIASGYNPKERPWYIAALASGNDIVITEPYVDEITKEVTFTYVKNIFDDEGKRLGIICLDVLLDRIYRFSLVNRNNELSFWVLHDKNHIVIAHPNTEFLGRPFKEISTGHNLIADVLNKEGTVSNFFAHDYLGRPSVFSMRPLENGWFLGIITQTDTYYSNLKFILWFQIVLGAVLASGLVIILIQINAAKERSEILVHEAVEEKNALKHLKNILNGIDAMICVTDPDTDKILFLNDIMKKVFEVEKDCIGQTCYKVLRKFEQRCDFCPCQKLDLNPEKEVVWEQYHEFTNRYFRSYSKYIKWPNGKNVHIQHVVDITSSRKAEQEIAEKNKELVIALYNAESANKAKSAFLANMSHEIRTPMNAILGITEILLHEKGISSHAEEALGKIYDSGNLLMGIINDILDLSKIEAGKLEIVPVQYDIPSLINDTVQLIRLRFDSKPIEFFLDIDENTPLNLLGDELRIKQILNNILSNAYKYTDKGEVRMSVSFEECAMQEQEKNENIKLIFTVSDTGQGMSQQQLDKLFDEYTRFNLDINRTTVGTGLGMSITKRLINLMGGDISVESEVGKGSVFNVHLIQKRINNLVCTKETIEKLRNFCFQSTSISKKKKSLIIREYMPYGSVLVVDDVESNIYVIRGMLLPYGLSIDTALSGFEAIEKIKTGSKYDIIFMDHMMPKMDGIETVKILRSMEYENYIIALTANALVGQAEYFLKNGFDGYISKPIDSRELNQILNEYIRNKKPEEVVMAAREEHKRLLEEGITNEPLDSQDLETYFALDAKNALKLLDDLCNRIRSLNEAELQDYEITVHGMKSALANINKTELSNDALRLEKAAVNKDFDLMEKETPAFIEALKNLVKNIENRPETGSASAKKDIKEAIKGINDIFLLEKLNKIKTACEESDLDTAKFALEEITQKAWTGEIDDIIDEINVYLLHSAFGKAAAALDRYLNKNK